VAGGKRVAADLGPALAVVGLLFTFAVLLKAQSAAITGTVADRTGAVIPAAEVVAVNRDNGFQWHVETNAAGRYNIPLLPPGVYRLSVRAEGFQPFVRDGIVLHVHQTALLDVTLALGRIEQAVLVEGNSSALGVQSATAELGAVMPGKRVLNLPLNGRNFSQLLELTPGVSPANTSQNEDGDTVRPVGSFSFPAVNGQTNRSNGFLLDGTLNTGQLRNTYAVAPILDTIQEFKVQSHSDQAEFGGFLGGVINVVTKSGGNELHGSGWEFLRNDALDARNFFREGTTRLRQNQFGFTAGGPVVIPENYDGRNRTFFQTGYQGFRSRRPADELYRVPTEANLRGDLSDWPRRIFDPATTRLDRSGTGFVRDPFPGNRIPESMLDRGVVKFARATLPAPIDTGVKDRNALDTTSNEWNQHDYLVRLDHLAGERDVVWFRASGTLQDQFRSGGRERLASRVRLRSVNLGASWVHTFGPSQVMEVRFGRVKVSDRERVRFTGVPPDFAQRIGFADSFSGRFHGGVEITPALNVEDFFSGGERDTVFRPTDTWSWRASYSKIVGDHTFKLGGGLNTMGLRIEHRNANSSFANLQTADPRAPGETGSPLASFLLNLPDSAGRRDTLETVRWGGVASFYFQDQWKAARRLTVNIGLRYDATFVPPYGREDDGNLFVGSTDFNRGVYWLQRPPPPCSQTGAAPCLPSDGALPDDVLLAPDERIFRNYLDNLQPRVGLAYRWNDATSVRASFGMVFDNYAAVLQTAQSYQGTWPTVGQQLERNLNQPSGKRAAAPIRGTNPFPQGLFPAPTPFEQVQWFADPRLKNPYSLQWNFGIQHELRPGTMLTANYVGSGSRRLSVGGFFNTALTPGPGDPRERSPFPHIRPTYYDRSWGRSSYHALQAELNRRFSSSLSYTVSYTWSKSIDMGCSGWFGVEGCSLQNPYDLDRARSVSGFDVAHMLAVNWIYQLPFGPESNLRTGLRWADLILGGWQINGIMTLHSGVPFNLMVNGDIANTGNRSGSVRPDLVGDPELLEPTAGRWFNTSAFAVPPRFTFGSAGRNLLRADGAANFDLSLFRRIALGETKNIEFRIEAFNALRICLEIT